MQVAPQAEEKNSMFELMHNIVLTLASTSNLALVLLSLSRSAEPLTT